jgi:hypothetical protein
MPQQFTEPVFETIQEAFRLASDMRQAQVYDLHLLVALLLDKAGYFCSIIQSLGA